MSSSHALPAAAPSCHACTVQTHVTHALLPPPSLPPQVRKVIGELFALCPTPAAAIAADTAAISALIQPLGLFRKRATAIQQLSYDFLYKQVGVLQVRFQVLTSPGQLLQYSRWVPQAGCAADFWGHRRLHTRQLSHDFLYKQVGWEHSRIHQAAGPHLRLCKQGGWMVSRPKGETMNAELHSVL